MSMLLILVEMEVVHMSMEEMTMTVMLLAMWCSYVGSGRALDDSDDGDDAHRITIRYDQIHGSRRKLNCCIR